MNNNLKGKIVLLCGWYYPDSVGGTEIYVHYVAKDLASSGYRVTIAAPSIDEEEHIYVHDGLDVYRYPVSVKPSKSEIRGETEGQYFEAFKRWLDKESPDLVHMHSLTRGCGFFHAQYVKSKGIPFVLTVHTPGLTCARGTMMRWGKAPCDGRIKPYRCAACSIHARGVIRFVKFAQVVNMIAEKKKRLKDLFDLSDRIVAVAKWLYDVLAENGAERGKLMLLRHGLPEEEAIKIQKDSIAVSGRKSGALRLGYVGRFDAVKGVHILIEAVKRVSRSIPFELLIYGRANNNEDMRYLARLRRMAQLDSRIRFCGEITDANRQEAFDSFDILAVPSIWLETGPLVIIEAFSRGIPVIGSRLGAIPEIVSDGVNGLLAEPGDILSWKNTIERILLSRELLDGLSRKISPVYGPKEMASEMAEIYKDLLTTAP